MFKDILSLLSIYWVGFFQINTRWLRLFNLCSNFPRKRIISMKNQWATQTIISCDKDLRNSPIALSQSVVPNKGQILETCHFTIKEYRSKLQGLQFHNLNCEKNSEISCKICLSTYLFRSFLSIKRGKSIRTKGSILWQSSMIHLRPSQTLDKISPSPQSHQVFCYTK